MCGVKSDCVLCECMNHVSAAERRNFIHTFSCFFFFYFFFFFFRYHSIAIHTICWWRMRQFCIIEFQIWFIIMPIRQTGQWFITIRHNCIYYGSCQNFNLCYDLEKNTHKTYKSIVCLLPSSMRHVFATQYLITWHISASSIRTSGRIHFLLFSLFAPHQNLISSTLRVLYVCTFKLDVCAAYFLLFLSNVLLMDFCCRCRMQWTSH